MQHSPEFHKSQKPVRKGWYETKQAHEAWGVYYNYWNGVEWRGVIKGLPSETSASDLDDAIYHKDSNLECEFVWRGIKKGLT